MDRFFCPACGYRNVTDQWPYRDYDGKFTVLWCGHCHFGWRHPYPDHDGVQQVYRDQRTVGIGIKNESDHGFALRIKRISDLYPRRGRLLDIGSGLGHFLNIARDSGWEVEGIEPGAAAGAFCIENFGIRPHCGFLEDFTGRPESYDVVTLWDVLEHVVDHVGFLERCVGLLRPGGMMVIAIPNASGWPARTFKGRWRYAMLTHVNYFAMEYIKRVLAAQQLQVLRSDHTIKIQSIVQGVLSWLPVAIDRGRIFHMGIRSNEKPIPGPDGVEKASPPGVGNSGMKYLRKIAFKANMLSLPWEIGDMVDLYCRKKE